MSKTTKKKASGLLIEAVYLLVSLLFFLWMMKNYGTPGWYDSRIFLVFLLGWGLLAWLLGPMLNKFFLLIYGLIFTAYLISQTAYNRAFHSYYRFNMAKDLASEVAGAKDSAEEFLMGKDIGALVFWVVLNVAFIVLWFVWQRRHMPRMKKTAKIILHLASLILIVPMALIMNSYNARFESYKDAMDLLNLNQSDYYIYKNIPTTIQFVNKYGVLSLGVRDAELFSGKSQPLDIDYEDMIDEMLAERKDQESNDYTGMFAGKSVMFVQAESFNHIALDEELTPTLYEMYQHSLRIDGFNTPALPGSTSDTEFMANTSLIPDSGEHPACYEYAQNEFPLTLPKMFEDNGYWAQAYHNNYSEYYNRVNEFPNFGYQDFLDCTKLGLGDTTADSVVAEKIKWIYAGEKSQWMAYWITYSGHQPYTLDSVGVSDADVARIRQKYPDMPDQYVSYLAKNMDLDHAMKAILDAMRDAGNLDDAVFVFYGDHIAKSIDYSGSSDIWTAFNRESNEKDYSTDLWFYNSQIEEPIVYQKTATVLDLIPTVANLWGLQINTHLILGRDIFDPDYTGFYFDEWSTWRTDNYTWLFAEDHYELNGYPEDKAREEMRQYSLEHDLSKQILQLDYFAPENERHTAHPTAPANWAW